MQSMNTALSANNMPLKSKIFRLDEHGTSLVKSKSICSTTASGGRIPQKLTKSEKKVLLFITDSIKKRRKWFHNMYGKKWVPITQEYLAKKIDVSRVTVYKAIKRLEELGYIEKYKMEDRYTNHTYSYTLKEGVLNAKILSNNIKLFPNRNNFYDKSLINQGKKLKKEIRETPQEADVHCINSFRIQEAPEVTNEAQLRITDMYRAVREIFGEKLRFVPSKKLSAWLGAARNMYFQTIELWRSFLESIKRSSRLMWEKRTLTLKDILSFRMIQKILRGEEHNDKEWQEIQAEKAAEERQAQEIVELHMTVAEIENSIGGKKCIEARYELLKKLGVAKYQAWLGDVKFFEEDGNVVLEFSKGGWAYDSIQRELGSTLKEKLNLELRFSEAFYIKEIERDNQGESEKCIEARCELLKRLGYSDYRDFKHARFFEEDEKVAVEFSYDIDWEKFKDVLNDLNLELRMSERLKARLEEERFAKERSEKLRELSFEERKKLLIQAWKSSLNMS